MGLLNFQKNLRLSLVLAKTNFKLRNEGSIFGVFWYLLDPLALFLIILLIRGAIKIDSVEHYPVYLLLGLLMFNFFRSTTTQSAEAITNNSSVVKSMKIDPKPLVDSRVLQFVFSHMIEIVLLAIIMVYYKVSILWLIFYPFIFILLLLFNLGVSYMFAVLGVYIRDLSNVWNIILRLLWFATPLFYVVEKGSMIYRFNIFNPLFYYINVARDIIIYHNIPSTISIMFIVIFSLLVYLIGRLIFNHYWPSLAERL